MRELVPGEQDWWDKVYAENCIVRKDAVYCRECRFHEGRNCGHWDGMEVPDDHWCTEGSRRRT